MQTVQKKRRGDVGSWCNNLCSSDDNEEIVIESSVEPKRRNSSAGIMLTVKSKSNRPMRVKQQLKQSVQSLKPKKCPLHGCSRQVYLKLSRFANTKLSFDQQPMRKGQLSAEMTTFIKQDCSSGMGMSPPPNSSPASNSRLRPEPPSTIFQNRMSTSKQESSQGSVLLIRNEQDDEKTDQMRIKNLFMSRGITSNRMSLTNVLNSITEEAEGEGLGVNTPKYEMGFRKKTMEETATGEMYADDRNITRHLKTNSGTGYSTANSTHARTRHSSYGSVAGCRGKATIRPLRLL